MTFASLVGVSCSMLYDQPEVHGVVWCSDVLLCLVFSRVPSGEQGSRSNFTLSWWSVHHSHLHCCLWVSKTCPVSLDVRAFPVVMVIPGRQEITRTCLLHVVFFGVWVSWCERAWLDVSSMWRNVAISRWDWKGLVCPLWPACRADGSMLGFTGFCTQACLLWGYFLISFPVFRSTMLTWWHPHCQPWRHWWSLVDSMMTACVVLNWGHLDSPVPRQSQRRRWTIIWKSCNEGQE